MPDKPGVYLFKGLRGSILYVGKATSLTSRVKSYCDKRLADTRGPHIVSMVEQAKRIETITTDSVLEALILEAALIKKHQPVFNTKEKDNKSFTYVVFTKEDFPRVLPVRGRILADTTKQLPYKVADVFGPFPQGGALKEAMKITRKIFPWRDTCKPAQGKPCFNKQIGLCPGVCTGEVSKTEYGKMIRKLKLFFSGKKDNVIALLEKDMAKAVKALAFEEAERIKRTIFSLNHIQDVSLIKDTSLSDQPRSGKTRIEAYDVAHTSGKFMVGVMVVVEDGEASKQSYRKFKIKTVDGPNDTAALTEILERRLEHADWELPRMFVVDGSTAQIRAAEKVLKEAGIEIPVVSVVKDEHHRPKEVKGNRALVRKYENDILLANHESHRFALAYHIKLRDKVLTK